MLLAEELKSLTQKLKAKASPKELAFFQFLVNTPPPYPNDKTLSEQEQVVFAAFCSGSPDKGELADKLRGTKPIRGIHYSNNLIELAAFAKFDLDKEIENLKSYAPNHSTRDYFVLKKLFPDVPIYPPEPNDAVDKVAFKLLTNALSFGDKATLSEAIQASEDLLDVYVINESYLHLLDLQPTTQYRRDLSVLTSQLARVIKRVDAATRIILTIGIGYLLFRLYRWFIPIIYRSWNEAEPIAAIIDYVLRGIEFLVVVLVGFQPEKLSFIRTVVRGIGTIELRIIGINRSVVEKRIDEYQHEPVELLTEATRNEEQ